MYTPEHIAEEKLREFSCTGELDLLKKLIETRNPDVNSRHYMNGWTALHWASKRGHENIVQYLLSLGADKTIKNVKGEIPADLCTNQKVLEMLGAEQTSIIVPKSQYKFVPNYIAHPPLNGIERNDIELRPNIGHSNDHRLLTGNDSLRPLKNENLVLRIRIAECGDPDFIEIEMSSQQLTFANLLNICCQELLVKPSEVERIRKLPNVRLRNDRDVQRLTELQYLELVLHTDVKLKQKNPYPLISTCKNQKILY